MRNGITRGIPILALALAVALAAAGAAQETPASGKAPAPAMNGIQVAIDPVTGQLRVPTPEEARLMSASLEQIFNQSTEGLQVEERADGTLVLDLQGRFMHGLLAQRNADGTLARHCTSGLQQALTFFLSTPSPRTQPALEKE